VSEPEAQPESPREEAKRIRLVLSAQAQRYARRDAPREVRLMAARGALPLPPVELATVLFALLHDPDAEVKSTASESLAGLPASVIEPVLSGPAHPALLSHLSHVFRESEERLERIALNPATDDDTTARLAASPFKRVVEIVSNNQERLIRCPAIVEALGANPLTGRSVIDHILSFLGVPLRDDDAEFATPDDLSEDTAVAALRAVLGDELGQFAQELVREGGDSGEGDEQQNEANLYALIQKLSVVQKVKLARLGNAQARGLLIRDRNKIVSTAAIQSPKITDNEVVGYAQSRNLSDEVLRVIASNRLWTRNYKVKLSLVCNPKCPQMMALKFVPHLHESDLRGLMRSKDVHANVAAQARRLLSKKGKV
jgi:hypothetical protein